MICNHIQFNGKGNIMDHHLAGVTGAVVATSTLGSYILDIVHPVASILAIIWLSLQIGDFIWKKYKIWHNKK